MDIRTIEGSQAKSLSPADKWNLLAPYLQRYGREALAYATLQDGMEYFIHPAGFISYVTVRHPVFARRGVRVVLSDPVCAPQDLPALLQAFKNVAPRAAFAVVSESCAAVLRDSGFKANCIGYEVELSVQSYNTEGNWKDLDLIKRARNEARREEIVVREVPIETVDRAQLDRVSQRWIGGKKVSDREIWIYARRPVFVKEEGVRKFVATNRSNEVVGFAFYDPMYRDGRVFGYSANICRCDEQRYGRLATAIHMAAVEVFRTEGCEILNLCLAPFTKLDGGRFNDDAGTKMFFRLSEQYGNEIYNFRGLSFHKSKYRGREKFLYFASNSALPANDVYLAFLSSDITRSYFSTMGRLLWGIATGLLRRPESRPAQPPQPTSSTRLEKSRVASSQV